MVHRRILRVSALLFVASIAAGACHRHGTAVSEQIERHFRVDTTQPLRLAEAAPFAWESVRFAGPYAAPHTAADSTSAVWRALGATNIRMRDDIDVLVFFRGDTVVEVVEHRRANGDFDESTIGHTFRRDNAVFRLQSRDGSSRFVPVQGAAG